MRLKKIKQFETPEGYKQSQITDFFKSSTSLVRRKLFVEDCSRSKMRISQETSTDNNSDSDFDEATPIKNIKLPYPIISDDEDQSISGPKKRKKSGATFKNQTSKISVDRNRTIIKLNKPSSSKERHKEKSTALSSPTKTNHSTATVSINKQKLHPGRVTKSKCGVSKISSMEDMTSESFSISSDSNSSALVKSHGTPCKKAKIDLISEEGTYLSVQIDLSHSSSPKTPSSSKTQNYEINHASPSCSTTARKIKNQSQTKIKSSPRVANYQKSSMASTPNIKAKSEEEKLNFKPIELLKELYKATMEDGDKRKLLSNTDIDLIEEFLKMDINHQYFLVKLLLYQPIWYNILKFSSLIKLDQKLPEKEIIAMYDYHKKNKFILTDITKLTTDELLNMLSLTDIKKLTNDPKLKSQKKDDIKKSLIQNCREQSTLTIKKSYEDILRDNAYKYLGLCIKLKEDVKSSFYKAYLLQTYSNASYYMDIQNYLKDMGYLKVLYPNYNVDSYTPFDTKEKFSRFFEAVSMKMKLDNAIDHKDNDTAKKIFDQAFEKLQNIDVDAKWDRYQFCYLQKFSAEYLYIKILKTGILKLKKCYDDVKSWLEFLIKNYPTDHAVGFWYKQLAHIMTTQHYKNYEAAAQIVIQAFQFNKKEDIFDFLQIYELNKLACKIKNTKTYKVPNLYCDQLAALIESPIDVNIFPKKCIKGCTDRSGTSGKRIYSYRDGNNEVTYGHVESIALKYYSDNENFEGIHCEGKLIAILFTLLFWDIIYEYYVPRSFISKLQSAPLDMYSSFFYQGRKKEIERRLVEISSKWSTEKMEAVLRENWQNHSHERSITDFDNLKKGLDEVLKMFRCIDKKVLSKILGRLATNFKRFGSGLPDLFLWNNQQLTCKFVEVKGENDTLQPNQILWIQHLLESGANVEVCHVSGVGAKGKKVPDDSTEKEVPDDSTEKEVPDDSTEKEVPENSTEKNTEETDENDE